MKPTYNDFMIERRLFTPEDKIAPGLYMKYWEGIVNKYGEDHLETNLLKQYREVRNGAIIAALWTKTTGTKHFVSFPHHEPNDVEIYSLEPTTFKGIPSWRLQLAPIQLTRCSLKDGETIIGQVIKKNTEVLSDTILVVHILGEDGITIDLNQIVNDINNLKIIHPTEIVLIAPIEDSASAEQTFAQILLYKRGEEGVRTSRVSYDDKEAFFEEPNIMRSLRGTGQAIEESSKFSLIFP